MLTLFGYTFSGLSAGRLLALALVAAAGLTALYLLRERQRRVFVSFSPLWEEAVGTQRQERLGRRLRRWLSWMLQMLVLVALMVAIGDPQPVAASRQGRSLVVLIDRSASMGAQVGGVQRLDLARAEARAAVANLGRRDRAMVVAFAESAAAASGFEREPRPLTAAIDALTVLEERGNLATALAFARTVLRAHPNPEILVVTDGALEAPTLPTDGPRLRTRLVGTPAGNVGIVGFTVGRPAVDRDTVEVKVTVQSFAAERRSLTLEIRGGPEKLLLARAPITLAPGAREMRAFSWSDPQRVALVASLAHDRDALDLDDRAFAVAPEMPRRRVLVVGAPNLYLDGALLSFGSAVSSERVSLGQFATRTADLDEYDAVIFDGVAPVPAPTRGRFIYFDPAGPGSPLPSRGIARDPVPSDFAREHPVLEHLDLDDLNIREARRLAPEPTDQVLARSLGLPLVVARVRPEMRLLALAFDPRRSDLPLRPTFPLMLANALDWLAGSGPPTAARPHRTGERARVSTGGARHAVLVEPGGARSQWPATMGAVEVPLRVSGHHRLEVDGRTMLLAASFVAVDESNTRRSPAPELARLAAPAPPRAAARVARLDVGGWALLLAFILGLTEWWTFHRRWTV